MQWWTREREGEMPWKFGNFGNWNFGRVRFAVNIDLNARHKSHFKIKIMSAFTDCVCHTSWLAARTDTATTMASIRMANTLSSVINCQWNRPNTCESVARALFPKPRFEWATNTNAHPKPTHTYSPRPPYCFFRSSHETQPNEKKRKKKLFFFSAFVCLWVVVVLLCRNNFSHSCDTPKTFLGDGN